jgi:hypothetical protein
VERMNCGTLYAYKEMSQRNPLYNNYVLIKKFFKKINNNKNNLSFLEKKKNDSSILGGERIKDG